MLFNVKYLEVSKIIFIYEKESDQNWMKMIVLGINMTKKLINFANIPIFETRLVLKFPNVSKILHYNRISIVAKIIISI